MPETKLKRHSILEPALPDLYDQGADEDHAAVRIEEHPFYGHLVIRSLDTLKALNEAVEPVLGCKLGTKPNHVTTQGDVRVFWLREGQWLVLTPEKKHLSLFGKLDKALSDMDSSVVDTSDGHTLLRLSGPKSRDVLMKGCPLDIHPRVFKKDAMALTRIVHADILLHHVGQDIYEINVRTSFAEYLLRWLYDAALEYGVSVMKKD